MNYPPNRTSWNRGDYVLHDADAKRTDMLMRVVRQMPDGRFQTEYVDPDLRAKWGKGKKSRLINTVEMLHGADLFGGPPWDVEVPS